MVTGIFLETVSRVLLGLNALVSAAILLPGMLRIKLNIYKIQIVFKIIYS